ncbi:hypothetical protein [Cecembia calidifontis]|uniref:hypothetical protein n=1 Tax=Cecembia calidifontis TaxID=1187080 RepID=UPI001F5F50EE|nr:hypothetical protein [Cecembia calidifontis]
MKYKVLFIFLFCLQFSSFGQFSNAARDSINKLTQSDFIQMLDQLGIKESDLRPGPSGNPSAPNAANSDENKVRNYKLPELMQMKNGVPVNDERMWWQQRRKEIIEDFESEMYGRLPESIP